MGCGKSKLDVVTGNTRKPSEAESVKGKENETMKRQESCRCRKTKDISSAASVDRPETTVEDNTTKPEEKQAGGDCGEKPAGATKEDKKPEETETTTSPPVTEIRPEDVVTEDIVNDVDEIVLPVDEPKDEVVDVEKVVEEETTVEDKVAEVVNTEIPPPAVEEAEPDVQTSVTTELEVEAEDNIEVAATENDEVAATDNDEVVSTENDELPVVEDGDKVDVVEENPADNKKEAASA